MPTYTPPHLRLIAATGPAAQRQYWRHVANRLALSVLADSRELPLRAPGAADSTQPPHEAPRVQVGTDVFLVRVEPVMYSVASARPITTAPLRLRLHVLPDALMDRLQLQALRAWPPQTTTEPLFRYHCARQRLVTRDGLSGDMVALFERLLAPHAGEMLRAFGGD
ncbi:hypothetical protein [Deinococcus sp.]|uniref:hypothetical protein n=1 Tax=Deinococcus sp. TaxID=47478 RepID=UPI0025DE7202|nr:hypothetical protein [Deinococcus sp.]